MLGVGHSGDGADEFDLERRLARVGKPHGGPCVKSTPMTAPCTAVHRRTNDSGIAILNSLIRFLPNPDKIRARLSRTGKNISLGEYLV